MSEIDDLMDLDPLALTKDDKALDAIIAYYRNSRAREEPTTGRLKKPVTKSAVDLSTLVKGLVKPAAETSKPQSGSLRRI